MAWLRGMLLWLIPLVYASVASPQGNAFRPAFHFMPPKNWMNDPNGPMIYKGLYHLFFQYNPYAPVFGNISWGHAVSKDLINWYFLNLALQPDQPYDQNGAFSGSITFVKKVPVILYTGSALNLSQSQNQAVPSNLADPLLRTWTKIPQNPIIFPPPPDVSSIDFRDPTTSWTGQDNLWRILVGAKRFNTSTGLALLYKSRNFVDWSLVDHPLREGPGTGMWECPDFYPVPQYGRQGVDDSARGPGISHVLKVSLDNTRLDAYAVGVYDPVADTFIPNVGTLDTGIGLVYDHGVFYASKTFFDYEKQRRVLWGWVAEKDTVEADIAKGYAGLQALPRQVWLDETNANGIRQWPVDEVYMLRSNMLYKSTNIELQPDRVQEIYAGGSTQLDVEVAFDIGGQNITPLTGTVEDGQKYCVAESGHNSLGPFGLLALASKDLQEYTAIYFVLAQTQHGLKPLICSDTRRSSLAQNFTKATYGGFINVTTNENSLSMRIIVDHSVIETFAQGGRTCITSRAYPTLSGANGLFLFNQGRNTVKVKNISVWKMRTANFIPEI